MTNLCGTSYWLGQSSSRGGLLVFHGQPTVTGTTRLMIGVDDYQATKAVITKAAFFIKSDKFFILNPLPFSENYQSLIIDRKKVKQTFIEKLLM